MFATYKMRDEELKEINKVITKKWKREREYRITAPHCGYFQMDLLSFTGLSKVRANKPYTYLFNIIDIYSRYGWSFPVRSNNSQEVAEHLKTWLVEVKNANHDVVHIQSDNGVEFLKHTKRLFRDRGINHTMVDVEDHNSQGIIERWNQTLRRHFNDAFVQNDNFAWLPVYEQIVYDYNHRVHSSIGARPIDVWENKTGAYVPRKAIPELEIGDAVRVLVKRKIFDKSSQTQMFTKQVFSVSGRSGLKYTLTGQDGRFARWELLKSKYTPNTTKKMEPLESMRILQREKRHERELQKDGIEQKNVIEQPRRNKGNSVKRIQPTREAKKEKFGRGYILYSH